MSGVDVRAMRPADLGAVARLHVATLPHGFFASLGARFLETYHLGFVRSPHAVALVAVDDADVLLGAIVGPTAARRHRAWVMAHQRGTLALRGVAALSVRPRQLATFVRTRLGRYVRGLLRPDPARRPAGSASPGGDTSHGVPDWLGPAVLTHVMVAPAGQGRGVGRRLVEEFADRCEAAGASEIRLVTLADERGASGFYDRLPGWRPDGDRRDARGTVWRSYRLPLHEKAR